MRSVIVTMLRARHSWLATKVAEAFGCEEEDAKTAVRKHMAKLNQFLNGEASCPSHILVYFQPRESHEGVSFSFPPVALSFTRPPSLFPPMHTRPVYLIEP